MTECREKDLFISNVLIFPSLSLPQINMIKDITCLIASCLHKTVDEIKLHSLDPSAQIENDDPSITGITRPIQIVHLALHKS